jgi:hypothetical protein
MKNCSLDFLPGSYKIQQIVVQQIVRSSIEVGKSVDQGSSLVVEDTILFSGCPNQEIG